MAFMYFSHLQVLDHALDIARQLGLRLIIPFVDQWRWVGGITSYARFRGFEENLEEAFWQEPQASGTYYARLDVCECPW